MPLELLQLLRLHRGQWLTMEAIQIDLGLAPQVVLQKVENLRCMGLQINTSPAYGFCLSGQVEKLTAELIEFELQTERIGRKVLVYESTDSTNDVTWQYAKETGYDGLAVFAEHQRTGRGRFQRRWFAPAGSSVLCSVLLQNHTPLSPLSLTLLAGLATAEAVENSCSLTTGIKWPNDIVAEGKKLAGIMVESRKISGTLAFVIGIGINCRQSPEEFDPEIRDSAVSIRQLTGVDVDRLQIAQQLLGRLDHWLLAVENHQTDELHDNWLNRCDEIGRRITVMCDGQKYTGRVVDVSISQGLLMQLDNGPIRIFDAATTTVPKK